jgi:hypothetical protein
MIGKTAKEVFQSEEAARIEARDEEILRSPGPIFDERQVTTAGGEMRMAFSRRISSTISAPAIRRCRICAVFPLTASRSIAHSSPICSRATRPSPS